MDLEAIERQVRAEIAAHGFHVVLVQGDGDEPAYGFTVGLWSSHGHPEVALFGVDDAGQEGKLHRLLDLIADRVAGGERFAAGSLVEGLVEGYVCAVRAVHPHQITAYLDFAARIHGTETFDCVQLVWPDPEGRFPWEPDFRAELLPLQPRLDTPPAR